VQHIGTCTAETEIACIQQPFIWPQPPELQHDIVRDDA
jgi:hypothetical protein